MSATTNLIEIIQKCSNELIIVDLNAIRQTVIHQCLFNSIERIKAKTKRMQTLN